MCCVTKLETYGCVPTLFVKPGSEDIPLLIILSAKGNGILPGSYEINEAGMLHYWGIYNE